MNFGQNLKRLRLSKNLTQEQVAQKFNVSTQTVSRWECSTTYPDVLLLPELSKLYGVTIDDLFKEDAISYENYAHRLLSVYEETQKLEDFLRADNEFQKLIQSGKYSSKDICMYGILYQNLMMFTRNKAEAIFKQGLAENVDDVEIYNAMGQLVEVVKFDGESAVISTKSYSEGLYSVKINTVDGNVLSKRLIIKH